MKRSGFRPKDPKKAAARQREWRRKSAKAYEDRVREESESRFREIEPNRKRKAELHARNFGDYADTIRALPCDTCGAPPPSHPHHAKSRGAGGTKRHLVPECPRCHRLIHDGHGPSREYLMERADYYWETYGDGDSSRL